MKILSELFSWKDKQAELRREHQQRKVLYDIKEIFLDIVIVDYLDEKAPIIEQLVKIMEKFNDPNIDIQENLM